MDRLHQNGSNQGPPTYAAQLLGSQLRQPLDQNMDLISTTFEGNDKASYRDVCFGINKAVIPRLTDQSALAFAIRTPESQSYLESRDCSATSRVKFWVC